MKIGGSKGIQSTSKAKKKEGTADSDGAFSSMLSSGAEQTGATQTTQSIAQVDALLAIQEAEDPTQGASRKRMRQRSSNVLQELDKLRMAMLQGNLTVGHMIDMADVVASHREQVTDPALTSVMDEIDLRAQVELAKMRIILDRAENS